MKEGPSDIKNNQGRDKNYKPKPLSKAETKNLILSGIRITPIQ